MRSLLVAIALILFNFQSYAQESDHPGDGHEHTDNYCSTTNSQVCAHIRFISKLNTKEEGQFILHVMTPDNQNVSNLNVKLWMQMGSHGHESSPVDIQSMGNLHYKITNAWFVMDGEWQVKVQLVWNGENHNLMIPLQIAN